MEKNLYITLIIYQESLHDAQSTKWKKLDEISFVKIEGKQISFEQFI